MRLSERGTQMERMIDALAHPVKAWRRFRKRTYKRIVRVELHPGATRIQFMRDGEIAADMVLTQITWHHKEETVVQFREWGPYMKEHTMHPDYPGLTIADVEKWADLNER